MKDRVVVGSVKVNDDVAVFLEVLYAAHLAGFDDGISVSVLEQTARATVGFEALRESLVGEDLIKEPSGMGNDTGWRITLHGIETLMRHRQRSSRTLLPLPRGDRYACMLMKRLRNEMLAEENRVVRDLIDSGAEMVDDLVQGAVVSPDQPNVVRVQSLNGVLHVVEVEDPPDVVFAMCTRSVGYDDGVPCMRAGMEVFVRMGALSKGVKEAVRVELGLPETKEKSKSGDQDPPDHPQPHWRACDGGE